MSPEQPSIPILFDEAAFRTELSTLEAQIRAIGADKYPWAKVLLTWLCGVALALGGFYGFAYADFPLVLRAMSLVLSTAGSVVVLTIAHTASHGAYCKSRWGNRVLLYLSYPFFAMLSAQYWRHSHIQVHHPAPNVVGVDADCDLRPYFAVNDEHRRDLPSWRARVQGWLLLLALPTNSFNMQRQGWVYLLGALRARRGPKAALWADLGTMLLHIVVFLLLPLAWASPAVVLGTYALRHSLIGIALFAILAPGHFPADAACLHRSQRKNGHFWIRQTATTTNYRTGFLGRLLCSGLEYQIEHHLLPSINHLYLPAISPLVRDICHRHGLPHRTLGWGEAIMASWKVFFAPKLVVTDIHSLLGHPTQESNRR